MKKIIAIAICIFCFASIFSGCSVFQEETPLDPLNYTSYVNKEIVLVENLLETHMANGALLKTGAGDIDKEVDNIKDSLILIKEAIESVKAFNAPNQYANDQVMAIKHLQDAYDSLYAYKTYLETKNTTYIDDYLADLSMAFANLKTSFSTMNN